MQKLSQLEGKRWHLERDRRNALLVNWPHREGLRSTIDMPAQNNADGWVELAKYLNTRGVPSKTACWTPYRNVQGRDTFTTVVEQPDNFIRLDAGKQVVEALLSIEGGIAPWLRLAGILVTSSGSRSRRRRLARFQAQLRLGVRSLFGLHKTS